MHAFYLAALALISSPALAMTPTMYIDIGNCETVGRPDASFKVMADGMVLGTETSVQGILIFKAIEDPSDPAESLTVAISTTIEQVADGSFQFENQMQILDGKIQLNFGRTTDTKIGEATFRCRGKKME